MKILPVAFDSLGTRSMCTFVETDNVKILIDPAAALGPRRYGLPPHEVEYNRLRKHWSDIINISTRADIIIITHYHYDHHSPDFPEIYRNKIVYIKDPEKSINRSQFGRAKRFITAIKPFAKEIHVAEGQTIKIDNTLIEISRSVYHGTNPRLGYVVEVFIKDNSTSFLFTSDVEGPVTSSQIEFILNKSPEIIFSDGPMTYQMQIYGEENLIRSIENIKKIISLTKVKKYILDHHLVRDLNFREKLKEVFKFGEKHGCKILTAANFLGKEDDLLEARRKELFRKSSTVFRK